MGVKRLLGCVLFWKFHQSLQGATRLIWTYLFRLTDLARYVKSYHFPSKACADYLVKHVAQHCKRENIYIASSSIAAVATVPAVATTKPMKGRLEGRLEMKYLDTLLSLAIVKNIHRHSAEGRRLATTGLPSSSKKWGHIIIWILNMMVGIQQRETRNTF